MAVAGSEVRSPTKEHWPSSRQKSNERHPIPHDASLYARRNIVERFFCSMKDMRRLATRFEKLKRNFLSMIHIFAIRCWIN